jgi:hypothetical protein
MLHQRTRPLPDAESYLHTSHVADLLHVYPRPSPAGPRMAGCPTSAPSAGTAATPSRRSASWPPAWPKGVRAS